MSLKVENVYQWFGEKKVLHDVNLEIAKGQIAAMVGPSGCGKSTLLRAILGTHPPKRGNIYAADKLVDSPQRNVGIVYQHYSLFPYMTAAQNVAFGLDMDETSLPFRFFRPDLWWPIRKKHLEKARAMLDKVMLTNAADLYPHEMSGGMRQRVAIAQALIMKPSILLLDEPFGALDEATREELQLVLLNLYQENLVAKEKGEEPPHTILIVTHELNEALYVSDRLIGLSQYHEKGELGATIVYDKAAPIFHPDDKRDFTAFNAQKDELREVVFNPEINQNHLEYVKVLEEIDT